jgi:hypothetical protein
MAVPFRQNEHVHHRRTVFHKSLTAPNKFSVAAIVVEEAVLVGFIHSHNFLPCLSGKSKSTVLAAKFQPHTSWRTCRKPGTGITLTRRP